MTPIQSTILIIFGILAFLITSDKSIEEYVTLIFKVIIVNVERRWLMFWIHPKNPITNLKMKWKYDRMAKQILEEMKSAENPIEGKVEHQEF